jgi:hypothetical protein
MFSYLPPKPCQASASAAVTAVTSCSSSTPLFLGHRESAKSRGRALGNRGEAPARPRHVVEMSQRTTQKGLQALKAAGEG